MNGVQASVEREGAVQSMRGPGDDFRSAVRCGVACVMALLGLLITPIERAQASQEAARQPVQAQITFICGQVARVDETTFFYFVPSGMVLVIESVGILAQARPESQLSVYLQVEVPVPQGPPGPTFIYPITLNKAIVPFGPMRTGLSGTLTARIYGAQPGSEVGITVSIGDQAVPECIVKASLSGYLLPAGSPRLSP